MLTIFFFFFTIYQIVRPPHSLSSKQDPFYSRFYKSKKMYHTAPCVHIQQWLFCPPLLFRIPSARYVVITSLLEQAPDWLTRREFSPKFRFFNSRESRPKRSIRAASFARITPQDVYSRLCIDLTCKSLALNIRVWCERTLTTCQIMLNA